MNQLIIINSLIISKKNKWRTSDSDQTDLPSASMESNKFKKSEMHHRSLYH